MSDNNYKLSADDNTQPIETTNANTSTVTETSQTGAEEEQGMSGAGKKFALGAAAAAILAGIGFGALYLNGADNKVETVVPNAPSTLMSDTSKTCEKFAQTKLKCNVKLETNDTIARDAFIKQSVDPGQTAHEGDEITLFYSRGPEKSEFPDLKGLSVDEAQNRLYMIGVDVESINIVDTSDAKRDTVVSASIESGDQVNNGDSVTLDVASGSVRIPDWVGKDVKDATEEAKNMGLTVNVNNEESDKAEGTILSQSPQMGEADSSAVVELTVAIPFAVQSVEIPDVVGMTQEDANKSLADAGFRNVSVIEQSSTQVTETKVTQVIPNAGESVRTDTSVVFVVTSPSESAPSNAPEEDDPTESPSPEPSNAEQTPDNEESASSSPATENN